MGVRHVTRLLLLALLLGGCSDEPAIYREGTTAYGTAVEITVQGLTPEAARVATASAITDLKFIEEVSDPLRPGPLGRTNQLLATTGEFSANPSLLPLIRQAQQLSRHSGGLFNPALGNLLEQWGFYRDPPQGPPPQPQAVAGLLARAPAMDDITLDGIRMRCRNGAVRLDFGDFGRAHALATAAARLREAGVRDATVHSANAAIRIGSALPLALELGAGVVPVARLALQPDEAAYTVSAAWHAYEHEGRHYHALLDPRSGQPAGGLIAVTVVTTDLAAAAAYATALFVAGPQEWTATARRLGLDKVALIDDAHTLHATPALAAQLNVNPGVQLQRADGL